MDERFWAKVNKNGPNGCWEWTGALISGYGRFEGQTAHRVAWLAMRGAIPPGIYVLHKCDNRRCVNPDHLFLGNQSDNMTDMVMKQRGPQVKLTLEDVIEIRRLASAGVSRENLSLGYGVSRMAIWRIVNYRVWKEVHVNGAGRTHR